MDKTYRPADVEARQYARWEAAHAFACALSPGGDAKRRDARPFSIVIPPPNVTGSLHMGHALNNTLQDILTRHARMTGRDALWQPGTDHAGIATQMVVERQLAAEGKSRADLGREQFIERVWQWKAESGGTITRQLRRLGASCDWSRERFTMDDGLSAAVRTVFVTLYNEGLIYRDKRLVNWDPKFHTAISDLEVQSREVVGKLWYFKYPIENMPERFITIATTRPETMLGDVAVAVHPDDERYKSLIDAIVVLPLVGRRIPIIADQYADPEKGAGAVKITPAHDFNDFEVAKRHGLSPINIFDPSARVIDPAPERFWGLDRFEARELVVKEMEALGLLVKVEDNPMVVPYGDRSGEIIEPRLTDQWYVNAAALAKPAIKAVEDGRIDFVPKHWENTYFEWMRNIQPWCISRQIWWGHQIPAWYAEDGHVFVAMDETDAQREADKRFGKRVELKRDADVLDTWFSSALWPFSTLGWPEQTPALARYYPTDALVTGFDIIFFWVARMAMMGLHFMRDVPFRTVYIHALVRDEAGQKMSKSKGNVLDPLELIDQYGADALRFTLAALAAQGRDIKLSPGRIEGYRNFVTKLWNAARYAEMNGAGRIAANFDPASAKLTVNRWIMGELAAAVRAVDEALGQYKFNEAAGALYQFTWHNFCDWYLEFTKPILAGKNAAHAAEVRETTAYVLDRIVELLHPFMPFVTEELWAARGGNDLLIARPWPTLATADAEAKIEIDWLIRLLSAVRAVRSDYRISPSAELPIGIHEATQEVRELVKKHRPLLERLGGLTEFNPDVSMLKPSGDVPIVREGASFRMQIDIYVDIAAERARLAKELKKLEAEIEKIDKKLGNTAFIDRAPAEVIEENRERRAELDAQRAKIAEAVERLAAV